MGYRDFPFQGTGLTPLQLCTKGLQHLGAKPTYAPHPTRAGQERSVPSGEGVGANAGLASPHPFPHLPATWRPPVPLQH